MSNNWTMFFSADRARAAGVCAALLALAALSAQPVAEPIGAADSPGGNGRQSLGGAICMVVSLRLASVIRRRWMLNGPARAAVVGLHLAFRWLENCLHGDSETRLTITALVMVLFMGASWSERRSFA
jgi:hypothetical protein